MSGPQRAADTAYAVFLCYFRRLAYYLADDFLADFFADYLAGFLAADFLADFFSDPNGLTVTYSGPIDTHPGSGIASCVQMLATRSARN